MAKRIAVTFRCQRSEETFHHCIVIAVAGSAHADLDLMVRQELTVIFAGVLAAAITMMDQVAADTPPSQSHFQSGFC